MGSGANRGIFPTDRGAWRELRGLAFDARLERIQDEHFRARLIEDGRGSHGRFGPAKHTYWLGDDEQPNYTRPYSESLAAQAAANGEDPVEIWLRHTLESNGKALFHVRFFNHDLDTVREFLKQDWVLPGIGDAGAHVGQIMDAGWTSFLLSYWYREMGAFSLEEAIRKMTSAQAGVIGLTDRGALAVGKRADINIIDLERIAERQPQLVHDFPHDAPRLIQKAVGFAATICNGQVILENDEHTGERPGRILRNQA